MPNYKDKNTEAVESILKYQKTSNINDLQPAMTAITPLINKRVNQFSAVEIPRYVLQRKAKEYVIDGMKSYDPTKAAINTHAFNQLRRLRRYVINRQNTARIPEHLALQVGQFKSAKQHLAEQHEREPSTSEIADYLSWPTKRVEHIVRADRASNIIQDDAYSFRPHYHPMEDQADTMYYSLAPEEQVVFDMLTGMHGQSKHTIKEAAKKLNKQYSQVYKIKQEMLRKMAGIR